jgi:hypothetical protein
MAWPLTVDAGDSASDRDSWRDDPPADRGEERPVLSSMAAGRTSRTCICSGSASRASNAVENPAASTRSSSRRSRRSAGLRQAAGAHGHDWIRALSIGLASPWCSACSWCSRQAAPLSAQRGLKEIPDPDPVRQLAALQPADGFEVNLFRRRAADQQADPHELRRGGPAVGRGVAALSADPAGRAAGDKVYILEDTTATAARIRRRSSPRICSSRPASRPTTPSRTSRPTSPTPRRCSISRTPPATRIADRTTVVLSGFGTEDTHHLIHSFRWGPGGHLYFTQSIYIHSHVETPWGVRAAARRRRLEVPSRHGEARRLHARRHQHVGPSLRSLRPVVPDRRRVRREGITYAFPGATYEAAVGAERLLKGLNPGQPKQSGLEMISGRHLPERWRDRLITNDFRGNRVNSFRPRGLRIGTTSRGRPRTSSSPRTSRSGPWT